MPPCVYCGNGITHIGPPILSSTMLLLYLCSCGVTTLEYCMRLDKPESLVCAALLLRAGAGPIDSVDIAGEGLLHRAVRCVDWIFFKCGAPQL